MRLAPKHFRIAFWVMLGVAITLTSLAFHRPVSMAQESDAPAMQTEATATASEKSEVVGSTDGIMLMAAAIVLIILIPILIRRKAWANEKPKN